MFRMLLRSRRYAGQFFKRRSWDLSTPPKVPNPYGAGYRTPPVLVSPVAASILCTLLALSKVHSPEFTKPQGTNSSLFL